MVKYISINSIIVTCYLKTTNQMVYKKELLQLTNIVFGYIQEVDIYQLHKIIQLQ